MKSRHIVTAAVVWMLLTHNISVTAQRFFSLNVDSLSRTYLLVNPAGDKTVGQPLIIVLHDSNILTTSLAKMNWAKLSYPPVIVFPVGLRNQWACGGNSDSLRMDTNFLLKTIFHVQNNYKTDLSRVFIVGMGSAFCLADYFYKMHPALVRAAVRWDYSNDRLPRQALLEPTEQLDSVVVKNPSVMQKVPASELFAFEQEPMSFRPYSKHNTLNFHMGSWVQSSGSRTEFDSLTLTDISDYHLMFGFQVAYHFTERWSTFVEADFMIIPKERTIQSISWGGGQGVQVKASGKGGLVVPYGAGLRYTIPQGNFRPFLSGSIGGTFLNIGGGTATSGTGGVNKSINKRKENVFRYSFATGIEYRLVDGVAIQLTGQYTLSKKIEPALASIKRFQGLSIQLGLVFILGEQQ